MTAWEAIWSSYWFVPGMMVVAAIALTFVTTAIDRFVYDEWQREAGWLATSSSDGARAMLTTIAASMIGTAGVVFSITMVTLTLAANQFGSRMLRNFMRDRSNQAVLGTFLAAFTYCLLILRNVYGDNGGTDVQPFIPQVGIIVAILSALAGVGVLIFFIHHVSMSIQAPNVVASVNRELQRAIDSLYPMRVGSPPSDHERNVKPIIEQIPPAFETAAAEIEANRTGHVQRVEPEQLLALAAAHDLIVRIEHRPGQFVEKGDTMLSVYPQAHLDADLRSRLQATFVIGRERSLTQDIEFPVTQLVEVAVRALSPGINAPTTARLCLDQLGASLGQLAERQFPSPYRMDAENRLRVLAPSPSLCDFMDATFDEIRQNSERNLAVLIWMLEVFRRLARHLPDEAARAHLARHARMVNDQAKQIATTEHDLRRVAQASAAVSSALNLPQIQ